MTLPHWLWGAGASSIGLSHGADKVRCSQCRRLTNSPAEYELGRVLCPTHQEARARIAYAFVKSHSGPHSGGQN